MTGVRPCSNGSVVQAALTAEGKDLAPWTRRTCENGPRHEFSPPPPSPSTTFDLQPGDLLAAAALLSCLTNLIVAMLQEQHAEEKGIDMIFDVATKFIFERRLSGQWGLHSRCSLRGSGGGGVWAWGAGPWPGFLQRLDAVLNLADKNAEAAVLLGLQPSAMTPAPAVPAPPTSASEHATMQRRNISTANPAPFTRGVQRRTRVRRSTPTCATPSALGTSPAATGTFYRPPR